MPLREEPWITGICSHCEAEIMGPPIIDHEHLWWVGWSPEWCTEDCRDRRDMIDAGRGHLLR